MAKGKVIDKGIPVFPNLFPYNELLLRGKLMCKSRNWAWNYRGPILLYTSSRNEKSVCEAYGLDPKLFPHKQIVGRATLVDVRKLTRIEKNILTHQFNPDAKKECLEAYVSYGLGWWGAILPGDIGFFFEDVERLEEPASIDWPQGAVNLCYLPHDIGGRYL